MSTVLTVRAKGPAQRPTLPALSTARTCQFEVEDPWYQAFVSTQTRFVPTLWIVLGPLGQSITATSLLAAVASDVVGSEHRAVCEALAVAYGVPVLGFALLWLAIAAALTARTARSGLPFSLTWWSFTFPVGTCVTGTSQLAMHTGLPMFQWSAVVLFTCLLIMWGVVLVRTAKGALKGGLLTPALISPMPKATKG